MSKYFTLQSIFKVAMDESRVMAVGVKCAGSDCLHRSVCMYVCDTERVTVVKAG